MSLRKLHLEGTVKTEVRLYTTSEHKHICSIYVELEKRGGIPPEALKKVSGPSVIPGLRFDFEALENIHKKIRSKGFSRLSEEEKKVALEAEPVVVKQADWKEHVGIRDNYEIVKILDVVYGLMSTMDHLVNLV